MLLASALNFTFGKELEPFRPYFEVLSVKKDKKISNSKCLIQGEFYDYRSGEKIGDITVERGGDKILLPDGSFAILMKLNRPSLKMHKAGYNTLVFDKFELKGGHRMKLKFFLERELLDEEPRFEVKKPVIYAYSNKDLNFELTVKAKGYLNFVYPPMLPNGQWSLQIKENQLYDFATDLTYPYLFWESLQYQAHYQTASANDYKDVISYQDVYRGDIVARTDLLTYLDTSLTEIGFSDREKIDFITFWVPQMKQYDYFLVQFLFDEECEQFATYEIKPAPDHLNRVYMLYSGYENNRPYIKNVSRPLKKMTRKGFYLVDWGGVNIQIEEDLNSKYQHTKE